ncbi:nucleotidyltransferase family protein [uncultured Anaerococcus sp.]|uniref:nucleotidyltransferase family protein n=1 Tax=uncultured Anaerococcus sp. TaxID=293428 RepID=UPI00262B93B1|nr:nucleotidyltransferase family protein [uncultured Anaerococcus sp.]
MKTLAIISEFNPFHNGHEYILNNSKSITSADLALSFMSGDFVQRGEPAFIDKFHRADSAMKAGFDMVIEMPTFISLQSAEYFAYKSVEILDRLNIDYLAFGIENIDPDDFLEKTHKIIQNRDRIDELTMNYMKNSSYTRASYEAITYFLGDESYISSNNILALEYIKAIEKIRSKIKAVPIKRYKSLNNEKELGEDNFTSSTAIRNNIKEDISSFVPKYSYTNINGFYKNYKQANPDYFYQLFKYLIFIEGKGMKDILGFEEGIDNYLKQIAIHNNHYDDFLKDASTKRYTLSRIKRLMLNYTLDNKTLLNTYDINFYKILAFNEKSQYIFKNTPMLPIIRKSDSKKLDKYNYEIYKKIIDASNLYSLSTGREINIEYTKKIGRH